MANSEKSEWRRWWQFFVRRMREFVFLTAWVLMSWALHRHIVEPFPLEGPPKYMLWTFEGVFDIYTLLELIMMFLWPYKIPTQSWFRKKSGSARKSRCQGSRRAAKPKVKH
jgi:hypothetical protein